MPFRIPTDLGAIVNEKIRPRSTRRGDGLRIQLRRIPGVTKGDAAKALAQPYRFQCAPLDDFTYTKAHTHNRYTTYRGEEYSNPAGRVLTTTTYRTLAVEWGGFVSEFNFDVRGLVQDLERIVAVGSPFAFLATHAYGAEPELEMEAVLETVVVSERAGEPDAKYIDLTVTEWREPNVSRRAIRRGSSKYPATIVLKKDGSFTNPKGFKIKKPLTLQHIATAAYGAPSLAQHVARNQKPPLENWGSTTPLIKHKRWKKKGGNVIIPEPPL